MKRCGIDKIIPHLLKVSTAMDRWLELGQLKKFRVQKKKIKIKIFDLICYNDQTLFSFSFL